MEQRQYFVACAVIFNDNGQILLTKRNNPQSVEVHGKWQLPGGSVELGEHPKDAAIREVQEETNLTINIESDRPFVFSHTFTNGVHVVLLVYKAKYVSGQLDISNDLEETLDAKWFEPQEIATLSSLPETNAIIQAILNENN